MPYGNIMYDRRIVRGNTYAQRTLPAVSVKCCRADENVVCLLTVEQVAAQQFLFAK